MRRPDLDIEPTPQAVARIRHWIVLLAGDPTAPAWNPIEDYATPDTLRAAARWLVDHGHTGPLDFELVGVLLALFSITFRHEMSGWAPRDAA
jgi:hypothetical protein